MKDLGRASFPPVGRCIFCGSTGDLRREHVVPFGLSGTAVLPKATCADCAEVTSRFEREVMRGPMRAVRVLRKLKSRSKHEKASSTQKLIITRKGNQETVELPLEQYPVILHFPIFSPPGYLFPEGYEMGVRLEGVATILFGPNPKEVAMRIGVDSISIPSAGDRPVAFARMIAKIAYVMAVAEGRTSALQEQATVIPAILGQRDEIGRWVGTITDPIKKYPGLLHRIAISEDRARGLLMGEVQLFADSETLSYSVILGHLCDP